MIPLLAHQGGWDEILLVLGPIVIIIGLLKLEKNRVDRSSLTDTSSLNDTRNENDNGNKNDTSTRDDAAG